MIKYKMDSPYLVKPFTEHDQIKENLLKLMDAAQYISPKAEVAEVNITKTDWNLAETQRDWVTYINEPLTKNLLEMYNHLGYDGFTITQIWFQQYLVGSEHGWHTHGTNFTNVYYLELPEGTPKTQLINPYNQKDIIEVDVKEGDLLIFPAYVLHKAPKNESDKRKTIISYNVNVSYSDENYGKNLI
jgi:hypothetical protein